MIFLMNKYARFEAWLRGNGVNCDYVSIYLTLYSVLRMGTVVHVSTSRVKESPYDGQGRSLLAFRSN